MCVNSSLPLRKKNDSDQNHAKLRLPSLNLKNNIDIKQEDFENSDRRRIPSDRSLYDPEAESLIKRLTRDNTLMFSPFVINRGNYKDLYDYGQIAEKRMVMEDFRKLGPISKFERDELYIPQTYRQKLSCQHCRKSYVAKMFTKSYLKRNNREPSCVGMRYEKQNGGHFCDVLGKNIVPSV
ncbi:hypothetical protein FSP39_002006 [Pinctada imbricata]|uniref:Uncharacterized protein n=1 Tax=Pinctada imbricata TaxID=66713 RepID=A0AA89C2B3_PINIB|nr:hypothetical protein FSP39_002006 [Pinctada imbricata]